MDGNSIGTAAAVAAFLLPIVSLIKRPEWKTETKHMLGLLSAIIAALVGAVVDGHVNSVQEFIPLLGTSFVTAQTLYVLYFSKLDINAKLEDVGAKTVTPVVSERPLKAKGR